MKDIDYYEAADRAISEMNRDAQREFGKLKAAKFDEINVIQRVTTLYRTQAKKARRRYFEVGFEGYLLGLFLCEITGDKAYLMAEDAITLEWVDAILKGVDPVTQYSFENETERKAHRLTEALSVTEATGPEIDKALRIWSKQTGQYAISVTDDAIMEAFEDAGIDDVMWITARDEKVCDECRPRDGKIYKRSELPKKHWGCRCKVVPVIRTEGDA